LCVCISLCACVCMCVCLTVLLCMSHSISEEHSNSHGTDSSRHRCDLGGPLLCPLPHTHVSRATHRSGVIHWCDTHGELCHTHGNSLIRSPPHTLRHAHGSSLSSPLLHMCALCHTCELCHTHECRDTRDESCHTHGSSLICSLPHTQEPYHTRE